MIAEDKKAPCLLPEGVIDRYWDQSYTAGMEDSRIGDLYAGVSEQMKMDAQALRREKKPAKY